MNPELSKNLDNTTLYHQRDTSAHNINFTFQLLTISAAPANTLKIATSQVKR